MKSHPGKTSQLSKQMRKRITKATFLLLASIGLLILLFWPSIVTAVPLTTQQQFDGVWQQARDIGNYQFNASALQTSHPTPRIENVGRGPEQSLLLASGLVNMPDEQMELNLQSGGRSLMVQMVDGFAYGRTDADDEWVELQDPDMIFAPGNDVMGFSSAAVNIAEVDNWQETLELDSITAVRTAKADTMYTFDISGLRFAEYMRQQAEIQMLNDGEMHPGMELGLAQHFVDMTGQGQLWVNEQGLPVYQTLHLEFPPDRGAMERVEADIITEFTGWNSSALNNQFFWTIPRLVEDPSILQTAPLTLLPNLDSFTPESWETLGLNLGLTFLLVALLLLAFANRRSPKLYPAIALAVIFSMLITPLLRVGQAHAFATNRQADYEAQASTPAEQEVMDELNGLDSEFNPTLDPLAGTQASAPAPLSQGIAELPAADQFSNPILNIPTENEALFASPVLQVTCDLNDSEADCDGDGLANGVEIFRLGTDPEDIDSDGDLISDATEVAGFNNGTQWYMNPLDADTNGDGLVDLAECFERIDVADGAFNGTDVSNIDCPDTDGDGAPDVFDYDNDGDGVPDAADSSPNFVGTIVDTAQDAIDINMTGYTTDSTLIVEYQIRPDNVDHLWQTGNSFIWPNDKQGQITFVHDREVTMIPMLEITIPSPASNSSNIVGSLPITPTKTINDIATDDTVDTWLDTATLGMYGINVTQSTDDGSLLAYVPLTVVNDPVGDMAVAWSGTMVYRPEVSNWGQDHEARVVWFISGNTSYCDVSDMPDVVTFVNRQGKTVEVKEDTMRNLP